MGEHRRLARIQVGGRVTLRSSGASGSLYDVSEGGIGVMLQGPPEIAVGREEQIRITPLRAGTGPIDIEAQMKWFNEGPRSTILGYEVTSFRNDRQRERFLRLVQGQSQPGATDPMVPE